MSDIIIHITVDAPYQSLEDWSALELAACQALRVAQALPPIALSVVITSAEHIQSLNDQFKGENSPTDVLAFPSSDDPVEPGEVPYLGDVIIGYPVAQAQAAEAGHSTLAELALLTVHGVLHLLGYDHDTPDRKSEMWALQSAALDVLKE